MRASSRLLIVLGLIEAMLGGLWLWLIAGIRSGDLQTNGDPAMVVETISSIMGGTMGAIAGVVLFGAAVMQRQGR